MRAARGVTAAAFVALALAGCGGDAEPFCGDGVRDPGEGCDDGNSDDTDYCLSTCTGRTIPRLTIKWAFNRDAAPDFTGDSCSDLGATSVRVTLRGGAEPLVAEESCSYFQTAFVDLAAGAYAASLEALDEGGALLTHAAIDADIDFAGPTETTEVVVAPDAWRSPPAGTFFFRVSWDGADCDLAAPPVAEQEIVLRVGGEVVVAETTDGAPVDGSARFPCQPLALEFPQSVLLVPFGAAELTVRGYDDDGALAYESVASTFVGAGINNPELVFDAAPLPPVDE